MDLTPYLIALIVILGWTALIYGLKRKGALKKVGLSNWGPFLMWKTEKGKALIDKLAKPRRFWLVFAAFSKVLCLLVMIFIMGLLIWEATLVSSIPAESAPTPEMIIGIPGINPLIPIWYGILGLIVAIVFHEFAHGILTRVGDLKLKTLGLIFFIFPMGAFVEPDEDELSKTTKRKRMNVFAVGASMNIIVAVFCAFLFSTVFLSSVVPVRDGPVVVTVAGDSPASYGGLEFGSQIVEIGGIVVVDPDDLNDIDAPYPGDLVSVKYFFKSQEFNGQFYSGVAITSSSKGLPAADVGIETGMILRSINDTVLYNPDDFTEAMSRTHPQQTVNITAMSWNDTTQSYLPVASIHQVTLTSKNDYLRGIGVDPGDEPDMGFLGVNSAYLGVGTTTPEGLLTVLRNPIEGATSAGDVFTGFIIYIALPFRGLAPVQSPITELFDVTGALGALPVDLFWILANSFYWIFWINLMVGMTNVLPAVPLDGGYLFRDGIDSIVRRLKKSASQEDIDRYVGSITLALAMVVLFLIIWQLIGPRVL
jgi:membrane-associated protease RseP (regulator of RpoE activity)